MGKSPTERAVRREARGRARRGRDGKRPPVRPVAANVVAIAALASLLGCGSSGSKPTTTSSQPATSASAQTSPPDTHTSAQPTTGTQSTTPTASTPTKAPERSPPNELVAITSPAIQNGVIPARYTCDGSDTPPTFQWKGVPPGTAELMLDIIKVKPVNEKLYFSWAVTHIDPATHGIVHGRLPAGAVVGRNGSGQVAYHLCPSKGAKEAYVAVLFALPHKLSAKAGFDPMALRRQAENKASYQNLYIFDYTRQ
jgi:phosphatidylethanolamine-binding protein (PEBP) family uncharacterized protein